MMNFNQSNLIMELDKVESIKNFISKNIENPVEYFEKEKAKSTSSLNNISYVEFFAVLHNKYEIERQLENSLIEFYNEINKKVGIVTPKEQQFSVKRVFLNNLLKELEVRKITNGLLIKLGLNKFQQAINEKVSIDSDRLNKILEDINYFVEIYSLETLIRKYEECLESNTKFSEEHKGIPGLDDLSRREFYSIVFDTYTKIEKLEDFLSKLYNQLSSSKTRGDELKLEVLIEFSKILQEYGYKLNYLAE